MKPFYIPLILVLIGAAIFIVVSGPRGHSQETHPSDWRDDYRNLTKAEFVAKKGETFFNAVQKGCDENLVCEWERNFGHGTVETAGFFYGALGCSCDIRYFPHHPMDGVVCSDEGSVISEGGEL